MAYRRTQPRTSVEVTIDRLEDYVTKNRDVLTQAELLRIGDAIEVLIRVDPVLRRGGR